MAFHGFSWFQPKNGPCLTNSSFKLRLDSNASASGLLTLAVFVQRMWRLRHLHTLPLHPPHPRPKGQCRTKRSNRSRWSTPQRVRHLNFCPSLSVLYYFSIRYLTVRWLLHLFQVKVRKTKNAHLRLVLSTDNSRDKVSRNNLHPSKKC